MENFPQNHNEIDQKHLKTSPRDKYNTLNQDTETDQQKLSRNQNFSQAISKAIEFRSKEIDEKEESLSIFDTAESLARRQEKLKKGIKIVIGGPPHSGKSVFIEGLSQNLDKNDLYSFSAAPDGEGSWLQRHYNNPDVVKFRRKGKFTPEFVADRKKKIHDWEGPLMIIDIGGRTSEENSEMIEGATHAIILSSKPSEVAKWRDFFEENNLEVIAKLHSDYHGRADIQRPMEPGKKHIVSSIHYLERGEPAVDRKTIKQVAGLISNLVKGNIPYQEAQAEKEINPYEVNIANLVEDLPNKLVERTILARDGTEEVVKNRHLLYSAIPQAYEKAKEYHGQPIWLKGSIGAWGAITLALAFEEAGSHDIRLRSPDGYVQIKKLPESEEVDTKWWEEPKQQGEINGRPVYFVHNIAHTSNNPVHPSDLKTMSIPKLPKDAIAIISSQGPNWLKASIASGYKDKITGIASFQPGGGSAITWSSDKNLLGSSIILEKDKVSKIVPLRSRKNKNSFNQEQKDITRSQTVLGQDQKDTARSQTLLDQYQENTTQSKISFNQYQKDATRNLANMSRTAHGIIDTSASNTKSEVIAIKQDDNVANLASDNFNKALEMSFEAKNRQFSDKNELRHFVEELAVTVNHGILKDGHLIRSGEDSDKYPYTKIKDLPKVMDDFYQQLFNRINDKNSDPIETAAFAEYNIDLTGHFFADGCGKVAKLVSSFLLMRNNHKLPNYTRGQEQSYEQTRNEYYSHAPKQIQGINPIEDAKAYTNFVNYYRTLF